MVEQYQTGDVIWIHDYHLLLVPSMVRAKLPKARIGLFVHSPFPSSEIFRCLPSKKEYNNNKHRMCFPIVHANSIFNFSIKSVKRS